MTSHKSTIHAPEPLVDEHVAAPVAGFTARSLKKARLAGADAPPHIRVGARRVKYRMSQVLRWIDAHTVPSTLSEQPAVPPDTMLDPLAQYARTISRSAALDAAVTALDRDRSVQRASRAVLAARQREHAAQGHRALIAEAVRAADEAGLEPTPDAIITILGDLAAVHDGRATEALSDAEAVRDAARKHAQRVAGLIAAIGQQAAALDVEALGARRAADALAQPASHDEVRRELMAIGGVDVLKVQDLIAKIQKHSAVPEENAKEIECLIDKVRHAHVEAAELRALLVEAPLIDLAAVARIAGKYPAIAAALANARKVLDQPSFTQQVD